MDETALVRHASGLIGTVVKVPSSMEKFGDVALLGERRSYITFLASITHDLEVQARLPQVLIGNERQFSAAMIACLPALPANIHVWRCKSAWNNHALMRRYLSLLASSLGSVARDRYTILVVDVARCHIDPTILAHAKRCGIRLCYIPALMTAVLQPCDTHLFSRFKSAFKEAWRRRKAMSENGSISDRQWLQVVADAIESVLPVADWESAFAAVGALAEQMYLGRKVCEDLGWCQPPKISERLPSVQAASLLFPRKMKVNVEAYINWERDAPLQLKLCENMTIRARRRPLPATFIGTVECPLTLD